MAMNLLELVKTMQNPLIILQQSEPHIHTPLACQDANAQAHHYPILKRHQNGLERCNGCALCAAACPSEAIFVQAGKNQDNARFSPAAHYAHIFEINIARCISCGYCVQACPVDALELKGNPLSKTTHKALTLSKPQLLKCTHS